MMRDRAVNKKLMAFGIKTIRIKEHELKKHPAVVGIMSGIIANNDWRISLLAGYAGTDFLENLYK